ncbi:PiggyBac transposable element-derived protein 4 [Plakobranchus ocellatus]|uniref:PiggyBac transposable element-derived protein 4 n=1 Tax=Plakobranchus ocellatus TaxID=259542 RepID=A0AAV3Z017_9GAST|nr:PiggyBac transposable element-derived protein 4 [Plakobranchus ocellatus]
MRFDDKETRAARRAKDIFAPFCEIWEDFNANLAREYVPGPVLTVDEQLMPWRGRCAFLQDLPSKPDKYGIKIFWICDVENGFPLQVNYTWEGKEGLEKPIYCNYSCTTIFWQWPKYDCQQFLHRLHSQHTSVS